MPRPASALRRAIPGACICGGTFLLEQSTLASLEEVRRTCVGHGTLFGFLEAESFPVRRDAYRCERGCVGGAERLVDALGYTVHLYGRPGVRVW